jgi:hypothetical protein
MKALIYLRLVETWLKQVDEILGELEISQAEQLILLGGPPVY